MNSAIYMESKTWHLILRSSFLEGHVYSNFEVYETLKYLFVWFFIFGLLLINVTILIAQEKPKKKNQVSFSLFFNY